MNFDKEIITDPVNVMNIDCPRVMIKGQIMNAVRLEGKCVVFYYNLDGVYYDSQDDLEEAKTSAVNHWHRCTQDDDGVKEFLLALKHENIGIIHYYTDASGNAFNIAIKAKEL